MSSVLKFDRRYIDSLFMWTMVEYDQAIYVYKCEKTRYADSKQAFLNLWLASTIDIENWNDTFSNNMKDLENIYDNFFVEYLSTLEIVLDDPCSVKKYIDYKVKYKVEQVKKNREKDYFEGTSFSDTKTIFNSRFVNLKSVHENHFCIPIIKPINCARLSYDNSYAGYKEFFIETEGEYVYYSD